MDELCRDCFEKPFSGFLQLWENKDWNETVRLAIHWYVEANAQAGSIEGAITLTQTALELLASELLVEKYKWLGPDGYERLMAADRLRLLFRWAGIPTDIPPSRIEQANAAKGENWSDVPSAMTAIRNTITHPTRKSRNAFSKHGAEARYDVWSLGLWALELCLLKMFGYHGKYANRITQRYRGELEDVPWMTPVSP
jgi:hypothetical protein